MGKRFGDAHRKSATNNPDDLRGESMITCDLCGEAKDCLQKEMDGKEYDICSECWNLFAKKLRGKGRAKPREIVDPGWVCGTVFLPPPRVLQEGEEEEPKPLPGEPPIIRGALHGSH